MKGMCGRFEDGKNSLNAREITNAMIEIMSDGPSESLRVLYSMRDGMAGWSGMDQASCSEEGALKVVIVGNVHWKNEELNGLFLGKVTSRSHLQRLCQTTRIMHCTQARGQSLT
jgi:hypothetical protein